MTRARLVIDAIDEALVIHNGHPAARGKAHRQARKANL